VLGGSSYRSLRAHQHFDLPQLPYNLLRRERLLWHFPGSFLSSSLSARLVQKSPVRSVMRKEKDRVHMQKN
jgi:hypothetical protein